MKNLGIKFEFVKVTWYFYKYITSIPKEYYPTGLFQPLLNLNQVSKFKIYQTKIFWGLDAMGGKSSIISWITKHNLNV